MQKATHEHSFCGVPQPPARLQRAQSRWNRRVSLGACRIISCDLVFLKCFTEVGRLPRDAWPGKAAIRAALFAHVREQVG